MLVNMLIGIGGVIALFLVVAATRPAAYRVQRSLEVTAPPERVFAVLNDLRQFSNAFVLFGAPLEKRDPQVQKTFEGQSFAWSGKEAGKGRLTITESVPGQKVVYALEFLEPMASKATVTIALTGTQLTWTMDGTHNFVGKAASVVMSFDKLLGADIEKSLVGLKALTTG